MLLDADAPEPALLEGKLDPLEEEVCIPPLLELEEELGGGLGGLGGGDVCVGGAGVEEEIGECCA